MKLRAIGRRILVKRDTEILDKAFNDSVIIIPDEVKDKEEGGCQLWTVCDVGADAFSDEPIEYQQLHYDEVNEITRGMVWKGRQIFTSRYPGIAVEMDVLSSEKTLSEYRMISCDEVGLLVARDGEEGYNV